ncbi:MULTISPECIES: hypothetical protein [Polaromonas]|uniref:Uncharacterized protein n=1 Tax=Polaromonas aquatica TaxID=332657 RepID=A0ABW1TXT3_9BURK
MEKRRMRANHLNFGPATARSTPPVQRPFDAMIATGKAVDVTSLAGNHFPQGRVAIESSVYEQHVAWPNSAMRQHMLYLEETARLNEVLRAASDVTRHESPAEFVHRGVACEARTDKSIRHSFVLERFESSAYTGWLIRQ